MKHNFVGVANKKESINIHMIYFGSSLSLAIDDLSNEWSYLNFI